MGSIEQSSADEVAVVLVPFPAQGHLNQFLQLSCLISSYSIPVHYVGFAIHNRQAKVRVNAYDPQHVAKINFHDIPTPPFASPPPDPNSTYKFPDHCTQAWMTAVSTLRDPVAAYIRHMAGKFRRVVVVHDRSMATVVQDAASILNAESYVFNCFSAFSELSYKSEMMGISFPVQHPKELPSFEGIITDGKREFDASLSEALSKRAGDIYNTCRLIEAPYVQILENEEPIGNKRSFAVGPILPTILSSNNNNNQKQHKCLNWLDKHEPNSVIYISFGTTVSLSDEQIKELALGLEQSKVKFLWVLRDADKADVFDEQVRTAQLPEGFEERVKGVGMVVRDWAPQPHILAHSSTGGFMSHCGWNSCLESITMGVSIVAWPMHTDQPRNASLMTDILKIAIGVREWKLKMELIKASVIESVVIRLMASEEGDEIRKRANELGATVRQATQPGGVSKLELDSFIAHITR